MNPLIIDRKLMNATEMDRKLLLMAIVEQYGENGYLPVNGVSTLAQRIIDEGGDMYLEATSPDGDTVLLHGTVGAAARKAQKEAEHADRASIRK